MKGKKSKGISKYKGKGKRRFKPFSIKSNQLVNGIHHYRRTISMNADNAVSTNWTALFYEGATSTPAGMGIGGPAIGAMSLTSPSVGTANSILYWSIGYKFNVANLHQLTDFTNLYDQYRIDKVVLDIVPYANSIDGPHGGTTGQLATFLHYIIDKDDSVPFTGASGQSIQDMQQRQNYKCVRLAAKPVKITIRPNLLGYVEADGTSVAAALDKTKAPGWLDLAHTTVDHFGLKMIFEGVNPTVDQSVAWFRINTTYYITFKGIR